MNKDKAIAFGIGLLTGVVIGGVVALLFAPQSGKETRQLIKDKVTNVVDAVKGRAADVVDAVKEKTGGSVHAIKS